MSGSGPGVDPRVDTGTRPSSADGTSATRAVWAVADQVVSSLTNFLLVVVVARETSATSFGYFSLVMSVFLFGVALLRALTAEPMMVRNPHGWSPEGRRSAGGAAGVSLVASAGLGLISLGAAVAAGGTLGTLLLVFALCLPGLMLQDFFRYVFINFGQPKKALLNDLLYLVLQLSALSAYLLRGGDAVAAFAACWAAPAVIAAMVAMRTSRIRPRVRETRSWLRLHKHFAGRYVAEAVASQGGTQFVMYSLVGVSGITAGGAMRAAETLFKPTAVITGGVRTAFIPELSRLRARPAQIGRAVRKLAGMLFALSILFGLPIVFLPDNIGRAVLGASWRTAQPLLIWIWLAQLAAVIGMAALIALRAYADPRRSLRAQLLAMGLQIAFGTSGAAVSGARGAVMGLAIASALQAAWWWRSANRSALETRHSAFADVTPNPSMADEQGL